MKSHKKYWYHSRKTLRKLTMVFVVVLVAVLGTYLILRSHADPIPQPIGPGGSNWGLTFDDEFNGTSLDTTKWTPTWTSSDGGTSNNSKMYASNVSESGGYLHLKTGNGNGSIVNSDPNYGPKPGYMITPSTTNATFVEWRASIPGSGTKNYNWPALWLSSENWPGNGEIDAYEGFGNTTTHLEYGTCCGSAPAFNNPGTGNVGGPERAWTPGFHTWGVLYTTTSATIYYDGQVESVYNNATLAGTVFAQLSTSAPNSIKGPMMLIMENAYANTAASNTDMQIDYVRVWQQGAASIPYTGSGTGTTTPPATQVSQTNNLATGKTFTSSAADSTTEPGNPVSNVNDGNESSRWISTPTDNTTLGTDLGASYNLSKVSILWAGDTTKDYEIQTSPDNVTWTTAATGVTNNTSPQLIDTTITATGRYVRILAKDRWNTAYGNSIYEIGIYGTAATATPVLAGDINGDGHVNTLDLSIVLSHDGQNYAPADLNHDGTVGAADLAILLAHWTW